MAADPRLTAPEWRTISAVLPSSTGIGRPRLDDRRAVAELLFFEVEARARWAGASLQGLYGRPRAGFLRVRRQRWLEDGTWPLIVDAGRPAMARWHRQRHRGGNSDIATVMRAFERQWG